MENRQVIIGPAEIIKSGVSQKTGKPWTLYKVPVDDQEVKTFTTFDAKYKDLAGQSVQVSLEKEVNGKFTNWKEGQSKKPNKDIEDLKDAMRIMNAKLDKLLARIEEVPF